MQLCVEERVHLLHIWSTHHSTSFPAIEGFCCTTLKVLGFNFLHIPRGLACTNMGKLLHKLVHGLVPSWLSKVKSANPSARKALPFSKAGANHPSSDDKLPPSSTPAPSKNTGHILSLVHDEGTQQDAAENSSIATPFRSSSNYTPRQAESKAEKVDSNMAHQHVDTHPSSLHVKEYNHLHASDHQKRDHDTSSQSQNGRSNADLDAVGSHVYSSKETLESQKELQLIMQVGIHKRHASHETECLSSGYSESAYKDLHGCKRTNQSLQVEVGNEEGDEEEELGGFGSNDIKVRWAWKRRKGEKGILSCELPESICSIVGNGRAVVKQSLEPQLALWESMVEMIVGNGLHEMGNLEFLLYCYLSLNEPHLYPLIQASFLQVLKDLERIA